jgi:myo-inositol-1(or 4)-monophosphatase
MWRRAAGRLLGAGDRALGHRRGHLIVQEAGGFIGPIRDGHKPMEHGDIIAANAAIFERFAAVIRERP